MTEMQIEADELTDNIQIVAVYEHSEDEPDADDVLVGSLEIDKQGSFTIVEAESAHHELLQRTVEQLNRKASITLMSEEPGEEPFATRLITVSRGESGFMAAMRKYMEAYYGYRLV